MWIKPATAIAAGAAINLTTFNLPDPFPSQSILCWDNRYASIIPTYHDCETIVVNDIATGPRPSTPILFSRVPQAGVANRVPKFWQRPSGTCRVEIDVPSAAAEQSNLLEIQATARAILMKCVLGEQRLGGMTVIGSHGGLA
ncbi:MAG: hypothetical protein Q9219_007608, partial [cf. Caloplaca sp. 3 TL-2023]